MENNKDGISVYKSIQTSKIENENAVEKSFKFSNIIILIISIVLPFVSIAIYVLWKNDRPKDQVYPLVGMIINLLLYCGVALYLLILLFVGVFNQA